jgi:cysteine-rich repeat protein
MRTRGGWWGFLCTLGLLLGTGVARATAPAFPGVITTTLPGPESELPIPDNGSLVAVLPSELAGTVVDVDVALDLQHPTNDQLDVFLVAPSGRTVTLTTDNGGGNDDVFAGVLFDDQAPGDPAPNVRNVTYTNLVPVGVVQPEGGLGALVGEDAAGPWVLVVVDDSGGSTGILHDWSLTVTTLSSLPPAMPPAAFAGPGGAIPDNDPTGLASTVDVAGLGARVLDVDVELSVSHGSGSHLDVFLTAPDGTRIELVTDVGNGLVDLYQDTVFDDSAPAPVSDVTLPPSGEALVAVVPEGALGAFVGKSPNGTWTLTVVDDTGGTSGTLDGWELRVTAVAPCGDGTVGPGEACDDGNATDGDGCDHDCSVSACGNGIVGGTEACDDGNTADGDGCSSTCTLAEAACDNCVDDDGNGLVDAADPGCAEAAFSLAKGSAAAKGTLTMKGEVPLADAGGAAAFVLGDGTGPIFCAPLGDLVPKGRKLVASAAVGGGTVTLAVRGGRVTVKGRKLDLSALDHDALAFGVAIGSHRFAGSAAFRTRGAKRVYP